MGHARTHGNPTSGSRSIWTGSLPTDGSCSRRLFAPTTARGPAGHREHEEHAALPLIRQVLTAEQWARLCRTHAHHIGREDPLLLPWLLDGAGARTAA
ncbi:hypothetical protein [Streptomyces virginiae]|uniref:hypothetical protein n=1 Tax=Streptomyces virginiae TaxID=1961 RepID=UPI0034544A74